MDGLQSSSVAFVDGSYAEPLETQRKTTGKFRDRVLNWVIPKRRKNAITQKRCSSVPGQLRHPRSLDQERTSIKPSSAGSKTSDNPEAETGPHLNKVYTLIPQLLVTELVRLARSEASLEMNRQTSNGRTDEISEISSRLFAAGHGMRVIVDWLNEQIENTNDGDEQLELCRMQDSEDVLKYQQRALMMDKYAADLLKLKQQVESRLVEMEGSHEKLKLAVFAGIRTTWPGIYPDAADTPVPGEWDMPIPFELAELERYEEEYRDFLKHTRGQEIVQTPRSAPSDSNWINLTRDMVSKKKEHESETTRLRELEEALLQEGTSMSQDLTHQVEQQKILVSELSVKLQQAISLCRQSGVHCKDSGSVIQNGPGLPFWNLERHGHEKVIGHMDNDWVVTFLETDQDDGDHHVTQADIAARSAHARQSTETWLKHGQPGADPEVAGPKTPATPGSWIFNPKLKDIEVGEAFCEE